MNRKQALQYKAVIEAHSDLLRHCAVTETETADLYHALDDRADAEFDSLAPRFRDWLEGRANVAKEYRDYRRINLSACEQEELERELGIRQ